MTKTSFILAKGLRKILNPPAIRASRLDKNVKVWDHSTVVNSSVGKYTYISDHTLISSSNIGSYCSIGSFCQIGCATHSMGYVSTSPIFNSGHNPWGKHILNIDFEPYLKTSIGNDVWIGTHVLIKSGVNIANGAVIGMGSVVTKNVGPYEIWAGNPARLIKKRFDEDTIDGLMRIKWWDWTTEKIQQYGLLFDKPQMLIHQIEEIK